MTTVPTPPPAGSDPEPVLVDPVHESFLEKVEGRIEDVLHDAEHDEEVVEPVVEKVAVDGADVAAVVDPELVPAFTEAATVATEVNDEVERVDPPAGPLVVDSSVQQGNRLVPAASLVPESPLGLLTNKIKAHWAEGTTVVADLRAAADKLEAELNKLRVGL